MQVASAARPLSSGRLRPARAGGVAVFFCCTAFCLDLLLRRSFRALLRPAAGQLIACAASPRVAATSRRIALVLARMWHGSSGAVLPRLQSTPGLSQTVAHLVPGHRRIRRDRSLSGRVVVSLGGQPSGGDHLIRRVRRSPLLPAACSLTGQNSCRQYALTTNVEQPFVARIRPVCPTVWASRRVRQASSSY
jgi:hypothetical protein